MNTNPRCESCPAKSEAWCVAEMHRRYCELAAAGNEFYLSRIAARSALGPGIYPPIGVKPDEPRRSEPVAGNWPACTKRTARWNCGGELTCTCTLGLGQAGIVEEHDCQECSIVQITQIDITGSQTRE